ncbi:MAG: hypothetical protein IKU34_03115 [Clostridia bacterium]|nr:hypothetical protein [Clostridia bacterium]
MGKSIVYYTQSPEMISAEIKHTRAAIEETICASAGNDAQAAQIYAQLAPLFTQLETLNFHLGALLAHAFPMQDASEKETV